MEEGRLRGRSARGLTVKLKLFPSGDREFFTWDGGIRPPKMVHTETGSDGKMGLKLGDSNDLAIRQ